MRKYSIKNMTEEAIAGDGIQSSDKNLQSIFLEGWKGYEDLEETSLPFNSLEYQHKIKSIMSKFEDATTLVNQIGLFSPNELIDEVSTDSLQYLLLPYFLGKLTLKLHQEDRGDVLQIADVYFKDYLQRCQDYDLCDGGVNKAIASEGGNTDELAQLMRAAHARNNKIAQFRRKKELEEFIKKLKIAVLNKTVEEEVRRDFFIKFLAKSIIDANEELDSIKLEQQMVEMRKMERGSAGGVKVAGENSTANALVSNLPSDHSHQRHHQHAQPPKRKPMQPFIITRNAAQKSVFGAGYPSLPVMTVNEFYEQRVHDGVFPDEQKVAKMNREQAIAALQDPNEKEDEENAVVEEQIESDDPEYLARIRRMDEYKDVVRRGDGNRYNRS